MPCINACQKIASEKLRLYPEVSLQQDTDAFGNRIQYGHALGDHDAFVYISSGEVELTPYLIPDVCPGALFRVDSQFTVPSVDMIAFSRSLSPSLSGIGGIAEKALYIAEAVYRYMQYRPGTTGIETTASQAFSIRQGVCQDYTHIFLGLCRLNNIAARYVNGFMLGIGLTHAWAEVYDGTSWIGIDPTNNNRIEYGYIKIAHGRDVADCPVNRGIFVGGAAQSSEVRVLTEEKKLNYD